MNSGLLGWPYADRKRLEADAAATVAGRRPFVDPTKHPWAWVNQGSSTITTNGASLALYSPADAADSFKCRVKAVPAKPYSIIIHHTPTFANANFAGTALGWMSSGGALAMIQYLSNGGAIQYGLSKYTNTTTYNSTYGNVSIWFPWEWIKLSDAAAGNRTIEFSNDGYNWVLLHSVATDDFLIPDRVFFSVNPRNATYASGLTIDSWEEL